MAGDPICEKHDWPLSYHSPAERAECEMSEGAAGMGETDRNRPTDSTEPERHAPSDPAEGMNDGIRERIKGWLGFWGSVFPVVQARRGLPVYEVIVAGVGKQPPNPPAPPTTTTAIPPTPGTTV